MAKRSGCRMAIHIFSQPLTVILNRKTGQGEVDSDHLPVRSTVLEGLSLVRCRRYHHRLTAVDCFQHCPGTILILSIFRRRGKI